VAGDAEHGGEGIERAEGQEAEPMALGQQHVERAGGAADVDDAERHLAERQQRAGRDEVEHQGPTRSADISDPNEIGAERGEDRRADRLVRQRVKMVDPADRRRVEQEADAEDEAHAEPEGDAGDDGETGDLAG